jgi:hypothetical protein
MMTAHAIRLTQDRPVALPTGFAPDSAQVDHAERIFGQPTHMVLVNDLGPAMSIMGWTLGVARAEVSEGPSRTRTVVVEILFTETGRYVVSERVVTELSDYKMLTATLSEHRSSRELRRHCEVSSTSFDPARDATLAAALDHASRIWPWLKRPGRTRSLSGSITLPFSL